MLEAIALGLAVPLVTYASSILILMAKQRMAFRRIKADPLYTSGRKISRLEVTGHPQPLLTDAEIVLFRPGLIQLKGLDASGSDTYMTFTGLEWETLHPTFHTIPERK